MRRIHVCARCVCCVCVCMLLYLHPIWSIMYEIYALCTLHLRQRFTLASVWYLPKDENVGFHISAYWAHAQALVRSPALTLSIFYFRFNITYYFEIAQGYT